jgi:hypothetical protein|tara:strand:- start:890 stop:1201 length:312 start_codon:yes stop_codon:yes gene_type:complete
MTPKELVQQIEHLMGRQPEGYMIRLMNDGLLDMASKKKEYTVSAVTNLESKKRWYGLDDQVIDITKVEILDTNSRYVMIPKLSDSHKLLREDTDITDDSLTSS